MMYNAALPANSEVLTSYSEDMIEVAYQQTGISMEIQSPLIKIICLLSVGMTLFPLLSKSGIIH